MALGLRNNILMKFTSFLPRAVLALLILQGPVWALSDLIAPFAGSFTYEATLKKVEDELAIDSSNKHCAEITQRFNLAWLHLNNKAKNPASSSLRVGEESSKVTDIKGCRFVELSQLLHSGELLTIGIRCPSIIESLIKNDIFPPQVPSGTFITAFVLNCCALLFTYLAFLGLPLSTTLRSLSAGEDLPDKFPRYVSSEVNAIAEGFKNRFAGMRDEHEKNIAAARADLSGAFAKQIEEKFVNALARDILNLQGIDEVSDLVIRRLTEEFSTSVKAGFGIDCSAEGKFKIINQFGLSDEQAKQLTGLAGSRFAVLVKKITGASFLRPDELADKRLEQMVSELRCDQCLIVPVEFNGSMVAQLCLFVSSKDQSTLQKLERTTLRIGEQIAPLWHLISRYQEAYRLSRFDYLTGVKNRIYLEQTLNTISHQQAREGEHIFLIFEGDNFRLILGSYGPRTIDKLIQELSQELLSAFDFTVRFKKASSRIKFSDYFYRIGGCRFLLVLEDSNLKKAVEMAEAVIQKISERKDWAHGMPAWSVSCGIAPLNQPSAAECLEVAMVTLDYIRSKKQIGAVVLSKDVPSEYMSRVLSMNNTGALGVFDPAAILQTFGQSQKSGILTATSPGGRVFWSLLENGKPTKARLGKLCGDAALVEFISEFSDCTHRLQDISTLTAQSLEEVNNLGGAYLATMPVNELISFAVKAKESAESGRGRIKTMDMIVHPTVEKQAGQIEGAYFKAGKSTNPLLLQVSNSLWDLCNGRFSFEEIIQRMQDEYPMALVWSAADFFVQNKLIKFSRLRISTLSDGADQSGARSAAADRGIAPKRICIACRSSDPLSQKFCVHCGAEMVPVFSNE